MKEGAREEYDNYDEEYRNWWLNKAYWVYNEKMNELHNFYRIVEVEIGKVNGKGEW